MYQYESSAKMLVLGIDGFEPRLAKKYLQEGKMPALAQFIARGACREDLFMLGGVPTVTPPLWTTLATGAWPNTHGITCFFGQHPERLDEVVYNLDSRRCKAEPLWNVLTEEGGLRTLVWHWPGSSWPPTSESDKLHVVDGAQPPLVHLGVAVVDYLKFLYASEDYTEEKFLANNTEVAAGAGCIIEDLEELLKVGEMDFSHKEAISGKQGTQAKGIRNILTEPSDAEIYSLATVQGDTIISPITPAKAGWVSTPPAGAKEFVLLLNKGLERRPGLILPNVQGIYDTVALYRSKKMVAPYVTLTGREIVYNVLDEMTDDQGERISCTRHYKIMDLAADGSQLNMIVNVAMDIARDDLFHPKALYQEVVTNCGYIPCAYRTNGVNERITRECMIPSWDHYSQWQADCLTYFMKQNKYEVIFSHLHSVDTMGHYFWHFAKNQEEFVTNEEAYQAFLGEVYAQADRYLARFLEYLDEGWTIFIVSDHGLIVQENIGQVLGEPVGVNVPVMKQLGYTVLQKDEAGRELKAVDWQQTRAVAVRGDYIYLNLKGRWATGIVEPEEQYQLEEQIISDLYAYRDPKTGRRVIAFALRNKDALILGLGGPECGDIIFFPEEAFAHIHVDSLPTYVGHADSSVAPIFVAAGAGIKSGCKTSRMIRQVDLAPTMAVLAGVRVPEQCEGAPIYQIMVKA